MPVRKRRLLKNVYRTRPLQENRCVVGCPDGKLDVILLPTNSRALPLIRLSLVPPSSCSRTVVIINQSHLLFRQADERLTNHVFSFIQTVPEAATGAAWRYYRYCELQVHTASKCTNIIKPQKDTDNTDTFLLIVKHKRITINIKHEALYQFQFSLGCITCLHLLSDYQLLDCYIDEFNDADFDIDINLLEYFTISQTLKDLFISTCMLNSCKGSFSLSVSQLV